MTWFSYKDEILILQLYLQPGSKTDRVDGLYADRLKVRVRAPAIENRANSSLIKFLSDQFAVPKSRIEISRGQQSRKKTIRIVEPGTLPDWFETLSGTSSRLTGNTT